MAGKTSLKKLLIGDFTLKRVVRSIILIGLLTYLGLFLYVTFFSDRIIFQPQPASYSVSKQIIKLNSGQGNLISARYFATSNARYTILYSHGNAEDIGQLQPVLEEIQRSGFNVFAFDYRGYGTSDGRSSEASAYQDEDAAYNYLVNELHVPPERIIALGRSLGGAVAVDLAARRPVGGLIIESSFVSAYRVVTRIPVFPFDRFNSLAKLKQVHCPVLVMHGRRDEVIGFWHGERLFGDANEPKQSLWIDDAGHNDLFDVAGPRYTKALVTFAELVDSHQNTSPK